ncbi:MAG: primosomal protein N' [Acetobacter sp.]|nr:primosomal protein N' [Acetobacter sp.]
MFFSFSLSNTSVFADLPPSPSQTSETDPTSSCKNYVSVLLPLPLPAPLTYLKPNTLDLHAGDIVTVPLGKKQKLGVVWETPSHLPPDLAPPTSPPLDDTHRLRAVLAKQDYPPLPEELRHFIDWVAAYTLSAPGLVMAMALRPLLQKGINSLSPPTGWRLAPQQPQTLRLTSARHNVLRVLADGIVRSTTELARCAQTSASVIHGLANAGALHAVPLPSQAAFEQPNPYHCPPILEGHQYDAATTLRRVVRQKSFSVTLLEGVTGAGKTEIYQEAIAACLENNQQVLVLLPEIALSAQWIDRFRRRFGVRPALWHSDVGHKNRRLIWREATHGRVSVVAGARSALFLPFQKLGLIIVDEEHESVFKQEEGVIYNARDMAVVRGRLGGFPVILVSATPSLETLVNVEMGRYQHIVLPTRHGGVCLPHTNVVDMRQFPPQTGHFLSPLLKESIRQTLAHGDQAMLFLNRRGYAPLTLCQNCGHRLECPHCTAWLVQHQTRQQLACHHCGYTEPLPHVCPACSKEQTLIAIGPGIERITEEAQVAFPEARLLVMSSDTIQTAQAAAHVVKQINQKEVDLIIGTQIVAKGWNFPFLTLVGVVDADLGLMGADLRAGERTFQLLHQVSGRAGREKAGRVLLQSYTPEHPVMQALLSGDMRAFMAQEAAQRSPRFWPPYGRLAALIVSATTAEQADAIAAELGRTAPYGEGIDVLGPAPAPLALLRGRHRRRLLLRTRRNIALQPLLRHWIRLIKPPRTARIDIDIDPVSFF